MVPQSLFRPYKQTLYLNSQLVNAAVKQLAEMCNGMTGADLNRAMLLGYQAVLKQFGDVAAQAALEFYGEVRRQQGVNEPFEGTVPDVTDAQAAQYRKDVEDALYEARAKSAKDTAYAERQQQLENAAIRSDIYEQFGRKLAARAQRRTMERADYVTWSNARRDPAKPRWVRVASSDSCGYCKMQSSRGFIFYSESAARSANRHDNCSCAVVVDFSSDPALQDYDQETLYNEYAAARAKAEQGADGEWNELTDAQRSKYARGYDGFLRNRIIGQMDKTAGRSHKKSE